MDNNGTLFYIFPWENVSQLWMTVFPGFEGVKGVLRGHIYPRGVAEGVNKPQKTPFTPENPWKKGNSQIWETLRHGKNVEQIAFFNFGKVTLLFLTKSYMIASIAQW